jgi:hypothetical protein
MGLSTRIKSLEAAVKRLEAAAGKGQRHCAHCRLKLRHSWPNPSLPKPRPEDWATAKCEFCQSVYLINLSGTPEEERELLRLRYSYTLEDKLTDPKAYALELWFSARPSKHPTRRPSARAKKINNPNSRALAKLRDEYNKIYGQKWKRLTAKYGERPFPDQTRLIDQVVERERQKSKYLNHVPGLRELEEEETGYLICAELEKIIWGQSRPETLSAVEEMPNRIKAHIEKAEQEDRDRKERFRLRNLEILNEGRANCGYPPLPDDYGKETMG